MSAVPRHVLAVLAISACGGGAAPASAPPAEVIDAAPAVIDAAPAPAPAPAPDDDGPDPQPGARPAVRGHRTLELLLQSTPPGALAAVDGVIIGATPTYWQGEFTGGQREFTFIRPGYAIARYQFVPVVNGIVHGRLQLISAEAAGRVAPLPPHEDAPTPPPAHAPAAPPAPIAIDAAPSPAMDAPTMAPAPAPASPAPAPAPPLPAPTKPTPGPMAPQPTPAPATPR
ncbi:MAG: hypothetical protein K8W52_33040 [Deltaproteobacteria bacterium]|nr:hypothetical protein [Deltaproteobacteria bacterium]